MSVDVLHRLKSVRKSGDGWTAQVPGPLTTSRIRSASPVAMASGS